jgi:hypothetical protein
MTDEELAQIADWLANGFNCPLSASERRSLGSVVAELIAARAAGWLPPTCPFCGKFHAGPLPCRHCGEPDTHADEEQ